MHQEPFWHRSLIDPSQIRQEKPRQTGITMIIDKGMGIHQFKDLLQMASSYIDFIKLGFGTSALYPIEIIRRKIALAHEYGVEISPGGTFLEVAVQQNKQDHYFGYIVSLGFSSVEISDGTIYLSQEERRDLIKQAASKGLKVLTEYGKKADGSKIDIHHMKRTVEEDIEAGASYVIIEGRESGENVGIYDKSGNTEDLLIHKIVNDFPYAELLIWEAPKKKQQVQLIRNIGSQVNLGNILPHDVYSLESLRRGLRSDTFIQYQTLP
ncbi:phosphosulfolactate synthase [Microaerobacter geothermalis]|uniref:phosphosulfolactate synthase n=1 Tax=Microaerobacter geothermalis TaxID=674972 RepID=UPI001F408EC2|nr:phosphosulfolactate synthase [Microaerobacter geothermalis]MCF6094163.1 phosphosulfolactate synthase [Microaerobacter geothermalis]